MKTRLELRLDNDVYNGIKGLAAESDISINQLMNGLARWAVKYGHAGEPVSIEKDKVISTDEKNCVWFGVEEEFLDDADNLHKAQLFFTLDYTDKRAVRDGRRFK